MKFVFYLALLLLTAVVAALHYLANQYFGFTWHPQYWILYIYFPLVTAVVHTILMSKINIRPQAFVTYFMGSMSVKLFLSLGLLLVVLYTTPMVRPDFAVLFMLMYFIYTALGVAVLFKKLRNTAGHHHEEKNNNSQ